MHPAIENDYLNQLNESEQRALAFWEAFKYPLEIFDVNKGEKPEPCEWVYGYWESQERWVWVGFELFRAETFEAKHYLFKFDEMHRWTRLPILEPEQTNE